MINGINYDYLCTLLKDFCISDYWNIVEKYQICHIIEKLLLDKGIFVPQEEGNIKNS